MAQAAEQFEFGREEFERALSFLNREEQAMQVSAASGFRTASTHSLSGHS